MMTTAATTRSRPRPPARRRVRQFLPPQHGAWAMLLLPYLVGILTAGFRWPHLPLLGAWLCGYLLSYYALQAVKSRRPRRFREQFLLYLPATVLFGGIVVAARPAVLGYAPVYALLLAANAGYAWRRQERALVNDLVSVAQSCLMVFVVATVAGAPAGRMVVSFVALLLYFTGTVCYVKTMIRERGNAAYYRASVAYHLVAVVFAAALSLPLAALFAGFAARAALLPRHRITPKQVGLAEIVACVLLGAVILAIA